MNKYLLILGLALSLLWGSVVKAAETPFQNTKVIEALVNTFSFNDDGTFDVSNINDFILTGDLTLPALGKLFFDGGDDTYIIESSANVIDIFQNGSSIVRFTANNITPQQTNTGWELSHENATTTNPVFAIQTDSGSGIGWAGPGQLSVIANSVEIWRYVEDTTDYSFTLFPVLIGTSTILTGTNTYTLTLGDNVSFPTLSDNQAAFYNKSGEMFAIDEDENESQLTGNTKDYPSDMAVSVNYPYVNPRTQHYVGIKTYISEHRAFELLQDLLRNQGLLQLNEYIIKHTTFTPQINWEDNQEAQRLRRKQEIQDAQDRIAQLDAEIAIETKPDRLAELQERKLKIKVPNPHVKRNPGSQWLISKGVKLQ